MLTIRGSFIWLRFICGTIPAGFVRGQGDGRGFPLISSLGIMNAVRYSAPECMLVILLGERVSMVSVVDVAARLRGWV